MELNETFCYTDDSCKPYVDWRTIAKFGESRLLRRYYPNCIVKIVVSHVLCLFLTRARARTCVNAFYLTIFSKQILVSRATLFNCREQFVTETHTMARRNCFLITTQFSGRRIPHDTNTVGACTGLMLRTIVLRVRRTTTACEN